MVGGSVLFIVALRGYYDDVPPAGAGTPAEADVRNAELMASLPTYPGSVLVEKDTWNEICCHPAQLYRHLTYVYGGDVATAEVLAFYRDGLTEAGWRDGAEGSNGYWFRRKNLYLILTLLGSTPSVDLPYELRERVPVATPPPGSSTFFAITVNRRIDCLRSECLELNLEE